MNQVNLMNLLYAVPETAAVQLPAGHPSQAGTGGMEFLLNLKQEIWAAQMPKLGAGLLATKGQTESAENGIVAGFGDVLQTEGIPTGQTAETAPLLTAPVVDGLAQELVSEGKPSALIDTLTASLKQAIAIVSQGKQPQVAEQNLLNTGDAKAMATPVVDNQTVATSPAPLQSEAVAPEPGSDSVELKLFGPRHPALVPNAASQPATAPNGEVLLQSPELLLADTWRIAAGILKSELLAQGVAVEVSAPQLQDAQGSTKVAPWALVTADAGESAGKVSSGEANQAGQTQAQLAKALVADMPRAATIAPVMTEPVLTLDAAVPTDAPESIRWFAQPANSGKQATVEAQPQPRVAPQAMVSELEFAGETKLKVIIQPSLQTRPVATETRGEPIVLDVKVALAGEANATLEAKLTLLPVVQRPVLPQVAAQPVVAEGMPDLPKQAEQAQQNSAANQRVSIPEHPSQLNPSARPIELQLGDSGIARMVMPMHAGPTEVDAHMPVGPQAVLTQAGIAQHSVATTQQAMADTGDAVTKAVPVVVPKPGKTTGLLEAKVADKVTSEEAPSDVVSRSKAALEAASRIAETRRATFASLEQKQTSRMQALSQLSSGAQSTQTSTPSSELVPGFTPMVGIGATDVPAQLMQFSSTAMEFKAPGAMNYLELANRLMDKVSAAKAAGNGVHSAKLTLNPANLGQMSVNIAVQGNSVALQIAVAAGVPKELLKDSLDALQQSLEASGLEVLEFKVEELGPGQEHSSNNQQAQTANPANPDRTEGEVGVADVFQIDPELCGTRVPA